MSTTIEGSNPFDDIFGAPEPIKKQVTHPSKQADKQQVISALQNLASNMQTTAEIMKRSEHYQTEMVQHATELSGAREIVLEWIDGIEKLGE